MKSKRCTLCKEVKLISEFTPNKHSKDGLTHRCKKCIAQKQRENRAKDPENTYRKQNKEWRKNNPEKVNEINRRHRRKHKEHYNRKTKERTKKLRDAVAKFKDKPCVDCSIKYPTWIMEFDHRPGVKKIAGIKDMVSRNKPLKLIIEEIKKCDVVCSNCHQHRTYARKHLEVPIILKNLLMQEREKPDILNNGEGNE